MPMTTVLSGNEVTDLPGSPVEEAPQVTTRSRISQPPYASVNAALAEQLFPVRKEQVPVYLDVDASTIREVMRDALGECASDPKSQMAEVVRPTMLRSDVGDFLLDHERSVQDWRADGRVRGEVPPCVGALAVLCLAAENMSRRGGYTSSAYFARLACLVGVPTDGATFEGMQASFRKRQPKLWSALEEWLVATGRGIPTAHPVGRYRHIGYPLSQTLVRATDREWLHRQFRRASLHCAWNVEASDLERCLDDWIAHDPPAALLTELAKGQARSGLLDAIEAEFRAWDASAADTTATEPPSPTTASSVNDRGALRLGFDFGDDLRPSLLAVALVEAETCPGDDLACVPDEAIDHLVDPEETLQDGWFEVAEASSPAGVADLLGLTEVEHPPWGWWTRRATDVLLLQYDDAVRYWCEVTSPVVGLPTHILVSEGKLDEVRAALGQANPRLRRASDLPGFPDQGWVLVSDVRMPEAFMDFALSQREDPAMRIKVSGTSVMIPGGERRLLVSSSIQVSVPVDSGAARVVARHEATNDAYEAPVNARGAEATFHDGLPDAGAYVVSILSSDGRELEGATRVLLGAPDAQSAFPEDLHIRDLSSEREAAWSLLSAAPDSDESCWGSHLMVQGARANCAGVEESPRLTRPPFGTRPAREWGRGWAMELEHVDLDGLLAYVSTALHGPYESLKRAARERGARSAAEAARSIGALSDLGHIEVSLNRLTCRPERWSVGPPVLVEHEEDFFLAGWRGESLLHALGQVTRRLGRGARLKVARATGGPEKVSLTRADPTRLEAELSGVPAPVPVRLVRAQTLRGLANCISDLRNARRWLPHEQSLPARAAIEQFDPRTGRWGRCDRATAYSAQGALRWKERGLHWHSGGDGDLRVGTPQIVRWLAAAADGVGRELVGWDGATGTLRFRDHDYPPSLLSRLLVLAGGGYPPTVDERGSVVYSNVSHHILARTMSVLGVA